MTQNVKETTRTSFQSLHVFYIGTRFLDLKLKPAKNLKGQKFLHNRQNWRKSSVEQSVFLAI